MENTVPATGAHHLHAYRIGPMPLPPFTSLQCSLLMHSTGLCPSSLLNMPCVSLPGPELLFAQYLKCHLRNYVSLTCSVFACHLY